jgi:hypothetical protein
LVKAVDTIDALIAERDRLARERDIAANNAVNLGLHLANAEAERDSLRASLAEAREALKPLTATLRSTSPYLLDGFELHIKKADIERARAVLSRSEP